MTSTTKNTLLGCSAACGAVFSWSLSGMIIKVGVSQIEPACHVFLRLVVASIIIWVYWYLTKKHPLQPLKAGAGMVFSFYLLNITNTFAQTYALRNVPYSWYVVLFAFQPIFALGIINFKIFFKKSILGILLAFGGVLLFIEAGALSDKIDITSLCLIFISMSLWTGYTLFVKKLNDYYSGTEIALMTVISGAIGALIMIVCIHLIRPIDFSFFHIENNIYPQIVLTGIFTSLVYGLYSMGLRLAPTLTIIFQYIDPIIGCILAFIFLHEVLTMQQGFGAILILSGIYLAKQWMPPQLKT